MFILCMFCYFLFLNRKQLSCLRYHTFAGDEIAVTTTEPPHVTEITQTSKGYDVPCLKGSSLWNLKCAY